MIFLEKTSGCHFQTEKKNGTPCLRTHSLCTRFGDFDDRDKSYISTDTVHVDCIMHD